MRVTGDKGRALAARLLCLQGHVGSAKFQLQTAGSCARLPDQTVRTWPGLRFATVSKSSPGRIRNPSCPACPYAPPALGFPRYDLYGR